MRVRRGDVGEVHVKEGRATVLREGRSLVLSDVATTILMATSPAGPTSLEEITATVVTKLGPPEPPLEAEELVLGLVLELVEHQLLALDEAAPATSPEVDQALLDAIHHIVSKEPGTWVPAPQLDGATLLAAAQRHRVTSVLGHARGQLLLPQAVDEKLDTAYRQESAAIRLLQSELVEAVDALLEAGVRVLAFEGLALAVQAHGHVTARGTDDHDLLVAPADLAATIGVLTSLGWRLGTGFPEPGRTQEWQAFVRDYSELPLTRRGSVVDLRWRLPAVTDGEGFDDLWGRRSGVLIGLDEVATLSSYDALVHAVSRARTNHPGRLRDLLDVWLLAAQPSTWPGPGRSLSPEQLDMIGDAVRAFGTPPDAPADVQDAMRLAAS